MRASPSHADFGTLRHATSAAITGIKCREAILESEDGFTTNTSIPRDKLIRTQTPQTFRLGNLIAAPDCPYRNHIGALLTDVVLQAGLNYQHVVAPKGLNNDILDCCTHRICRKLR